MMVCGLFCVFWLSFGLLQLPTLGLATAYSATGNAAEGLMSKEMNAVIALYLLIWGFALGEYTYKFYEDLCTLGFCMERTEACS